MSLLDIGLRTATDCYNYILIERGKTIDVLSYWAWRCITSVIDHAIQIYVGQKDNANQWKVTVLEEFLHAVLLYQ